MNRLATNPAVTHPSVEAVDLTKGIEAVDLTKQLARRHNPVVELIVGIRRKSESKIAYDLENSLNEIHVRRLDGDAVYYVNHIDVDTAARAVCTLMTNHESEDHFKKEMAMKYSSLKPHSILPESAVHEIASDVPAPSSSLLESGRRGIRMLLKYPHTPENGKVALNIVAKTSQKLSINAIR
jgi:hypothetical protein